VSDSQATEQQHQKEHAAADQGGGEPTQRELEAELARAEDRYKRALADLDNYRKRTARETDRRVTEASDALLRDWLEAVDSVERAMWMHREGPLYEGLRAVLDQMEAILARQGVERVGRIGEPFDPTSHEAVGVRETSDAPDRSILDVARSGYGRGDQVLRPAQVIVARGVGGADSGES
jgi:molecular chaperone GrpE